MLISFTVSNYKSFKGEQLFTMQKDTSIDSEKDSFQYEDGEPGLSCVAAIYGANAAGKSNFLQAIMSLRSLALGNKTEDSSTQFINNDQATSYDITFLAENQTKYNYSLDMAASGIQYERLVVYTSSQPTTIYEWSSPEGRPELNSKFFNKEERVAVPYNVSENNSTVFSQLAKISDPYIKSACSFFKSGLVSHNDLGLGKKGDDIWLAKVIQEEPAIHQMLNTLLPVADLGIQSVELVEKDSGANIKQKEIFANAMVEYMKASDQKPTDQAIERLKQSFSAKVLEAVFKHKIGDDYVNFSTAQESDGTIAASNIFIDLLPVLSNGSVYLVDELDRSLHPSIVAQVIDIFSHKETNPNGAQLIFTTHDISLLDSSIHDDNLLDRDEVWFVEKNNAGESEIYPLTSIKYTTTKHTNCYRKYIEGRYGATPRASITSAFAAYWRDQNDQTSI